MQSRPPIIVMGLMSGTSLDGVDAAFLETDGQTITRFGPSLTLDMPRENPLEAAIKAALAWQFKGPPPDIFSDAQDFIDRLHIQAVKNLCNRHPDWAKDLSLIGYHGQTILHHPPVGGQNGQTLQLGSGENLAEILQKPVIWDFRSQDMRMGGQGAPLAPIYHQALVEKAGLSGVTAVLNLGGVGNVTLVGEGVLKASDTGPANGPLDQWMVKHGQNYDKGGKISLSGTVDHSRVENWLSRPFFSRAVPRSADRYDFDVMTEMSGLTREDGAASLAAFCALSVVKTLRQMAVRPDRIILCGGGRHNRAIEWMLGCHIAADILSAEDMGWNSDAIEAQAFAYMAARRLYDLPISFPATTGVRKAVTGGRLAQIS